MALTEKDLRAIAVMLDDKFKLSETKQAYEAQKRKGNLNDPASREQSRAAHEAIMAEIKAIQYLLSDEFFSLPFPPS